MKKLIKPTLPLAIAGLFVSCSLWQTRAPVFPPFGHLPGFAYANALNGDLTLLRPKSLSVLGSYKADFKKNLRSKLEERLGQSVNIGRHAAILEKMGSATINYYPGTLIQEPAISKTEIERVSPCPLPELDTGQKNLIQRGTLTEAIDWKIFVTCTLKSWNLMDLTRIWTRTKRSNSSRPIHPSSLPIPTTTPSSSSSSLSSPHSIRTPAPASAPMSSWASSSVSSWSPSSAP